MKLRHATLLLSLTLGLAVMAASPAAAAPKHYGTGIHLWALNCGPFPGGHSTVEYVSSAICPNNPPPGCHCTRTLHDFPVDHPYPSRVVIGNPEPVDGGSGGGVINVIVDVVGAIQCGATVASDPTRATCGAPFNVNPANPDLVGPEIIGVVESLRGEIEDQTGTPVESFTYYFAERQ